MKSAAAATEARSQRTVSSQSPGTAKSRSRGQGIEFDELRPYQRGDDLRTIDWRVTARTGRPLTKRFREDREHSVFVILDQRPGLFFGSSAVFKSVMAAKVAAIASWSALERGDAFGGLVFSDTLDTVRSSRSRQSVMRFLKLGVEHNRALDQYSQSSLTLTDSITKSLQFARTGSTVIIISDFADADETALLVLQRMARYHALDLICVLDPMEEELTVRGSLGVSDGYEHSSIRIEHSLRQQYRQHRQHQHQELLSHANKAGIRFRYMLTDDNPGKLFTAPRLTSGR